jgi:phosphopantetheinyl transferase
MPLLFKEADPLRGVWKIDTRKYDISQAAARMAMRRQESLGARHLLADMIGEHPRVAYHSDGMPYLPEQQLYVSISHTVGYAAAIVSERTPVGIDIEYLSDRVLRVRRRFMSAEEEVMIDKLHEVEHSLVCWCAKETLFKILGRRGVDFRNHLHILPFDYTDSGGSLTVREKLTAEATSYVLDYLVTRDFVLTWSRG